MGIASRWEPAAQAPSWTIDPVWEMSVGDGEGAGHHLLHVRDAAFLRDGSLAVLGGGTKDIRMSRPDGGFVRAVGREGEAPGESKTPAGLQVLESGDVLVYDPGNQRVTRFDSSWSVSSTVRVAFDMGAETPA